MSKRKPNETFEDYKIRRKEEQKENKTKLKGRLFVIGRRMIEKEGKKVNTRPKDFQGTIKRKSDNEN